VCVLDFGGKLKGGIHKIPFLGSTKWLEDAEKENREAKHPTPKLSSQKERFLEASNFCTGIKI
jgi:hypothetical protein